VRTLEPVRKDCSFAEKQQPRVARGTPARDAGWEWMPPSRCPHQQTDK
jgi:hypothetical protein